MADYYSDTPLGPQEQAIKRRQQIAEQLMAQGQTPIEANRMAGVYVAPVNPLEVVGKLAQAYFGNKRGNEANAEYEGLAKQRQQGVADALAQYQQMAQGTPAVDEQVRGDMGAGGPVVETTQAAQPAVAGNPRAAVTQAMLSQYPELQRFAAVEMANQNRKEDLAINNQAKKEQLIEAAKAKMEQRQYDVDQGRISKQEADARNADLMTELKQMGIDASRENIKLAASLKPAPDHAPIQIQDAAGNVRLVDRQGNLIKDLGGIGKPTAGYQKTEAAKTKMKSDLNTTINELENATKDGGLIDQSTGSGAGALVDMAAGFVGKATPGSIAAGRMQPIFDMALKMVPRFEGPQSDKDTASYKEAAGNLANPRVPNATKKAAGREILRLMKQRRGQFTSNDVIGTDADTATTAGAPTQNAPRVVDW